MHFTKHKDPNPQRAASRLRRVLPIHLGTKTDHVVWVNNSVLERWTRDVPAAVKEKYVWGPVDKADFKFPQIHEYGQVHSQEYFAQAQVYGCGREFMHAVPICFFVSDTVDGRKRVAAFTKHAHISTEVGDVYAAHPRIQHRCGGVLLQSFLKYLEVNPDSERLKHLTDIARNMEHAQCVFVNSRRPRGREDFDFEEDLASETGEPAGE